MLTILTLLTSTLSLYYLVSDTTSPRDGDVAIERVIFELVERASSWIVSHSWITDSTTTSTKFGYIQIYFPLFLFDTTPHMFRNALLGTSRLVSNQRLKKPACTMTDGG